MAGPVYRRVVIKLSGEYFAGPNAAGFDQPTIDRVAGDLIAAKELGVEIAVVIGGGNLVRGVDVSSRGVSRTTGDTVQPSAIAHVATTLRNQISLTDRNATNAAIANSIGHRGRRSRRQPIGHRLVHERPRQLLPWYPVCPAPPSKVQQVDPPGERRG